VLGSGAVFTGDHIMGWSTTLVSPPDGDMGDYFKSLEKMFIRNDKFYIPTHGSIIKNPKNFVKALIGHRKMRESQIKKYLEKEEKISISDLVAKMYPKLDKRLLYAAGRSVLAHLLHMKNQEIVSSVEGTNNLSWYILN
jgi:glyoxylase-like metal-dependent hydrolase (beta-lactamase superfamily II)